MKDKLIEEVTTPDGHIAGAKLTGILRANQLLKEFETALATGHPSPKAATKLLLALGLEDLVRAHPSPRNRRRQSSSEKHESF